MSKFEKFQPDNQAKPEPLKNITFRDAEPSDSPVLAIIKFDRDGGDLTELTASFENEIKRSDPGKHRLLIALHEEQIVGFARVVFFEHPESPEMNLCPEGWYLTGVNVLPKYRRRGIADFLTQKRLEWVAERADAIYYFANSQNEVSINLHAKYGFEELTREFIFPGVKFECGEGVLFKANLIHLEQV